VRLHDLAERPERDPVSVREAASLSPVHDLRPIVHPAAELGEETGLADAGLADDGDELDRRLAEHSLERLLEQTELVVAADERRCGRGLGVDTEAAACTHRAPDGQRLRLPFDRDGLELVVLDRRSGRTVRVLPDDEASHGRLALEAGGDVHDVPRGDPLALAWTRRQRHDRLARGHCRAYRELQPMLRVELLDRVEDTERGSDGSLGVVLVRRRRTEDRHHRVADELLDRAAEALDLRLDLGVVRAQHRPHVLGIGLVRARGEADEVDEEHGDDLPLLARRNGLLDRSAAGVAEPGAFRVLGSAARTARRGRSL